MKKFYASHYRGMDTYTACLIEDGEECHEYVTKHESMGGRMIHEASFETSLLGGASRDEYLRCMMQSVIRG